MQLGHMMGEVYHAAVSQRARIASHEVLVRRLFGQRHLQLQACATEHLGIVGDGLLRRRNRQQIHAFGLAVASLRMPNIA